MEEAARVKAEQEAAAEAARLKAEEEAVEEAYWLKIEEEAAEAARKNSEEKAAAEAARVKAEQEAPIGADDPEIQIETDWAEHLDLEPPASCCNNLGRPGSQYDATAQVGGKYGALLVTDLFSPAECARLIAASEQHGYGYTDYPKSYRGNLRLIATDRSLADAVWERIKRFVPEQVQLEGQFGEPSGVWEAIGLNECWRLAKYSKGDQFKGHCDACFRRDNTVMSMFTLNAYMNSEFEGGETRFYEDGNEDEVSFSVKGDVGLCCLFRQPPQAYYHHDGAMLENGIKYLFRTDVMYKKLD